MPSMSPAKSAKLNSATTLPLNSNDCAQLSAEIAQAGDNEVLSAVTCTEPGVWEDLRIIARGTCDSAPAILRNLKPGDILLHNHPSGDLTPSNADMNVAYLCGNSGIGFAIHDNECTRFYTVVEPFIEKPQQMLDKNEIAEYLSRKSPLASNMKNFEERPGQKKLLFSIVDSLNNSCSAILEGETGIGKSMAYLLPSVHFARKNKCRVVISTNTINLQHQLVNKDLPLLEKILPFKFKYCLIKGRRNYLCIRKVQEALAASDGEFLLEVDELDQFNRLVEWAEKTADGSLSDLSWVPRDSLWEKVASDKDSCPGVNCYEYNDCFFYTSRRRAAESDLMVVNHHLFFADLALRAVTKEYSQTAVIPAFKAAVLDEAHNLEETATRHFGYRTTSIGTQRLLGKIYQKKGRRETGSLSTIYAHLSRGRGRFPDEQRAVLLQEISQDLIPSRLEIGDISRDFFEALVAFYVNPQKAYMGEHRLRIGKREENRREFDQLAQLAFKMRDESKKLANRMKKLLRKMQDYLEEDDADKEMFELPLIEVNSYSGRLDELGSGLTMLFDVNAEGREKFVHFFSVIVRRNAIYPAFNSLPIVVADQMLEYCFNKIPSVIMVSGTLTTRKNFSFIKNRLGLDREELEQKAIEGLFPSPFDYATQARLLIPTDIPEPSSPMFQEALCEPLLNIIRTSQGGTLVLCTSYGHLNYFYSQLTPQLCAEGIECYKQGELERHYLLELFKEDGNAVLFATDSFWEGVDIPGSALRNLVIMRLPFANPDDPVLTARNDKIRQTGGNPFRNYQLPMAAIKLKQGFGRLIRNKNDKGTIWILDKRIVTKSYGAFFIESLPELPVMRGKWQTLVSIGHKFFCSEEINGF